MRQIERIIRGARWAIEFKPEFRIVIAGKCICSSCRAARRRDK